MYSLPPLPENWINLPTARKSSLCFSFQHAQLKAWGTGPCPRGCRACGPKEAPVAPTPAEGVQRLRTGNRHTEGYVLMQDGGCEAQFQTFWPCPCVLQQWQTEWKARRPTPEKTVTTTRWGLRDAREPPYSCQDTLTMKCVAGVLSKAWERKSSVKGRKSNLENWQQAPGQWFPLKSRAPSLVHEEPISPLFVSNGEGRRTLSLRLRFQQLVETKAADRRRHMSAKWRLSSSSAIVYQNMEEWAEGLLWCQDYKHGQDSWGGSGVGTKANGLSHKERAHCFTLDYAVVWR